MDNGIDVPIWVWFAFIGGVISLLAVDLGLFQRKPHAPSVREAATWSVVWISLSLLFGAGIFLHGGSDAGLAFITGYLIEYSLSVDNIFVFVLVFAYFKLPPEYHHRVLFWGVLGALVMRGMLIGVGSVLLSQFAWVIYIFGAMLIVSGIKMARSHQDAANLEGNFVLKHLRRLLPVTDDYVGQRFFLRRTGVLMATPLLLVLVVIETTDLIFAIDSIPAIFAVTDDPFLVFTSNVCAILGLRSLYFLLAGVVTRFHYLTQGLALILVWVGTKMLLTEVYHVPIPVSLGVIAALLAAAIGASLLFPPKRTHEDEVIEAYAEAVEAEENVQEPVVASSARQRELRADL